MACLWVMMASVSIVCAGSSSSFNTPADYHHSLGIQQPSAHALGQRRSSRFWWQDSNNAPFEEGAAKKVGIRASSFGADPPRAHSIPPQNLRQQNYGNTGTASATFSAQTLNGPLSGGTTLFPGCAAALKCVQEQFCNRTGVMVNQPVNQLEKEFRVPLMPCLNTETNQEGVCCRDPLYEDPWPADMPMPGMPPKPIVTPNRPAPPPPQPVGYPSQPAPVPSFPIPLPQTSYLPPTPVVQPPAPNTNYIPPPLPAQPSNPAPVFNQLPPSPQVYTPPPPPTTQTPWTGELAPVTLHPGCASALKCVREEFCNLEGLMVNQAVSYTAFEKEYLRVPLMPCLNTDTNQEGFCCRDPLYEDPWPADMPMPGMAAKPQPTPVATNSIAVVQQPAVLQQQYLPPPVQQQYLPPPVQQVAPAPQPQAYYNPPQQQAYNPQPSGIQQQQQLFKPYVGPLAADTPFPGCAAALKCVQEQFCNMEGVMVNEPVNLSPLQKEYRVPLMSCLNVDTNQVGFCCRDPLYEDPWPADMPMPGMAPKQG